MVEGKIGKDNVERGGKGGKVVLRKGEFWVGRGGGGTKPHCSV